MAYDTKAWRKRIAERSDMCSQLTHLTRPTKTKQATEVLFEILSTGLIRGSTTESGFIVGSDRAVCFQDAPLASLCQNIYYEQKLTTASGSEVIRYVACGLMFPKPYAFKERVRPVFYEQTEHAKTLLPETEWWRIVNLDLSDGAHIIDWTHEREWRCKGDFAFDISQTTLLLGSGETFQKLSNLCAAAGSNILTKVKGIVTMSDVHY